MRVRRFASCPRGDRGAAGQPVAQSTAQTRARQRPDGATGSSVADVERRPIRRPRMSCSQSIATSASRCKSILLTRVLPITHSDRLWQKRYLDRTELRRDVLRIRVFYWMRGFREAQVDTVVAQAWRRSGRRHVQDRRRAADARSRGSSDTDGLGAHDCADRSPRGARSRESRSTSSRSTRRSRTSGSCCRIAGTRMRASIPRPPSTPRRDWPTRRSRCDPRWLTLVGDIIDQRATRRVSERTIRNSLSFKTGDLFRRVRGGRESAPTLRVGPVPARVDLGAPLARQHACRRRHPGAARQPPSRARYRHQAQRDSVRAARRELARLRGDSVRTIEVDVSEAPPRLARAERRVQHVRLHPGRRPLHAQQLPRRRAPARCASRR